MRQTGFAILVFLASFVGGWVVVTAGALILGEVAGVSQAEGAYAMGVVFTLGPMGGLLIAAGVTAWVMARRRRSRP